MEFTKAVDAAIEPLTRDISALCKIKSVEDEPQPGKPFGEGPAKALDAMLSMGQAMGFRTENFDHYVGHIEFGQGEELIGILGHIDVVPAGDGWTAYGLRRRNLFQSYRELCGFWLPASGSERHHASGR